MLWFLIGVILLIVFLAGGRAFVNANPSDLARGIRLGGGIVLMVLALFLVFARQWALAMPVAIFALSLLGWRPGRLFGGLGGLGGAHTAGGPGRGWGPSARPSGGQRSSLRTHALAVELDHDTGAITGRVLSGPFAGRSLDDMSAGDLKRQRQLFAGDEENRRLFEAYLDRRLSGWREDFDADADAGQGAPPFSGPMSKEEAYEVLGLPVGAGPDDIRAAHKRLMKVAHPDRGGSTFLAARINEAKDVLLGGRD